LDKLSREVAKVVALPEIASMFGRTGGRVLGLSGTTAREMVKSEVGRWSRIIKEAGITAK
jgi:tripartite-type tricarboxylate transporter receptor subunit TctC